MYYYLLLKYEGRFRTFIIKKYVERKKSHTYSINKINLKSIKVKV